jgi:hypothetical protein
MGRLLKDAWKTRRVTIKTSDLGRAKAAFKTRAPGKFSLLDSLRNRVKIQSIRIAELESQLAKRMTPIPIRPIVLSNSTISIELVKNLERDAWSNLCERIKTA